MVYLEHCAFFNQTCILVFSNLVFKHVDQALITYNTAQIGTHHLYSAVYSIQHITVII